MQTTSSRITFVDFARTTGIFLIVMGHAMGRMLHGGGLLYKYFYTFHVPLFFFISGYLFSCGKNGIGAFLYKKVKTLLVPYFCFGFISLVIFKLLGSFTKENLAVNAKEFDWLDYTLGILYGSGNTEYLRINRPLWFIPCLFVVLCMMYVLVRFAEKVNVKVTLFFVFSIVFAVMNAVNVQYLHWYSLPFGIETAFGMVPFALIGYGMRQIDLPVKSIGKVRAVGIASVLFAIGMIIGTFLNGHIDCVRNQYSNLTFFNIAALCSIFAVCLFGMCFPPTRWMTMIGTHTMAILLMHKFPILFFQTMCPGIKTVLRGNENILGIITAFLISILSIILCLMAEWILLKVCPWILGKKT